MITNSIEDLKQRNHKNNPINLLMSISLIVSGFLLFFAMAGGFHHPSCKILLPVFISSCIIGAFLLFALIVAWLFGGRNDKDS